MQDRAPAVWREPPLDVLEHLSDGPNTVYGEDLAARLGAGAQHVVEYRHLVVEGSIEARARIEPDLADIGRFRQQALPKADLRLALAHHLRVEAQRHAHVGGAARELLVPAPGLRRGRHGERCDLVPVALRDQRFMIRVEVEMTMEVDQLRQGGHLFRAVLPRLRRAARRPH